MFATVTATLTAGRLVPGRVVEFHVTGRTRTGRVLFESVVSGTFDRVCLDVHDADEDYLYLRAGVINGLHQTSCAMPLAQLDDGSLTRAIDACEDDPTAAEALRHFRAEADRRAS